MASSSASSNLWDEILNNVSNRKTVSNKNVIVLGEPQTGKSTLLGHMLKSSSGSGVRSSLSKPIALPPTLQGKLALDLDLATGYEWVDVRDEGDEETLPPLSIYTPRSSDPSLLELLPLSLSQPAPPPTEAGGAGPSTSSASSALADTAILIVLDWTKPGTMVEQLLGWLGWVDEWAAHVAGRGEEEESRERLQYHLQHYNEPPAPVPLSSPSIGSTSPTKQSVGLPTTAPSLTSTYNPTSNEVLPLGPGTLTRNSHGVPIVIVCTKADQIDAVAEEHGFGGGPVGSGGKGVGGQGGWEERTDWIGQVLRLVALMHGAALFYTSQAHPSTFSLLRSYLLHRLFSPPPILTTTNTTSSSVNPSSPTSAAPMIQPVSSSTRFPFLHRANVLDRDQVLVPAGWDSWGKIMVLREGFEPERVTSAWEVSVKRRKADRDGEAVDEDEEDVEDLWAGVVPEIGDDVVQDASARLTTTVVDQTFLGKEYAMIQADPKRDPRQSFRNPATAGSSSSQPGAGELERLVGVVGPMGSGGLSMPGVERAMADMEGLSGRTNARDARPSLARDYSSSTVPSISPLASPSLGGPSSSSAASAAIGTPGSGQPAPSTEALHNFFQSLLQQRKNPSSGVAGLAAAAGAGGATSPSASTTQTPTPAPRQA